MMVEFSIVPLGTGKSVSTCVAKVIDIVDKSGLEYRFTDMATIVEGNWDEVFALIKSCHHAVLENEERLYTRIVIDDEKVRRRRLGDKVSSVEEKLRRAIKK